MSFELTDEVLININKLIKIGIPKSNIAAFYGITTGILERRVISKQGSIPKPLPVDKILEMLK